MIYEFFLIALIGSVLLVLTGLAVILTWILIDRVREREWDEALLLSIVCALLWLLLLFLITRSLSW